MNVRWIVMNPNPSVPEKTMQGGSICAMRSRMTSKYQPLPWFEMFQRFLSAVPITTHSISLADVSLKVCIEVRCINIPSSFPNICQLTNALVSFHATIDERI